MSKVIQLSRNGELSRFCRRRTAGRTGPGEEAYTPARSICEQNSGQRLGRSVSTRVEWPPQLPTMGLWLATPSTPRPPTKLTQAQ